MDWRCAMDCRCAITSRFRDWLGARAMAWCLRDGLVLARWLGACAMVLGGECGLVENGIDEAI
jgi:hypothetical protein